MFIIRFSLAIFGALLVGTKAETPVPFERPCKDNPDFSLKSKDPAKEGYGCKEIGKLLEANGNRRFCKRPNIQWNCPEVCDVDCTKPIQTCPKKNKGTKKCKRFEPGLECHYNYVLAGCDLECVPSETSICTEDVRWETMVMNIMPCPEDPSLPIGKHCDPMDCPIKPPKSGSACIPREDDCRYDYSFSDCSLQCVPSTVLACDDGIWVEIAMVPEPCVNATNTDLELPIDRSCDPSV
jgi:hypothetical protein